MAEGSVIVKQSVKTARYPRRTLRTTPQKIDLGRVSEASLISSAAIDQSSHFPATHKIWNLTHMDSAIKTEHRSQRCEQADHCCETNGRPITTVIKVQQSNPAAVARRRHDQQGDGDGKKAKDVNEEYNNFHHWQLLGHGYIENDSKYYHSNDEECTMPWLSTVAVVIEGDEALNLKGDSKSVSLPMDTERSNREHLLCSITCNSSRCDDKD